MDVHRERPVSVCVLEDEQDMGEQIRDGIQDNLGEEIASVVLMDNLTDVNNAYDTGNCDILIADLVVKRNHDSERADADALDLLRKIKISGHFLPRIGHTAYQDKYVRITEEDLVNFAFDKKASFNSTEDVIDCGTNLVKSIHYFRKHLREGFNELQLAAMSDDTIDRHDHLATCRNCFGHLKVPEYAPRGYRKCTIWLTTFVMRLSSVPSTTFNLFEITKELCKDLLPLINALAGRTFNYEKDGLPILDMLEAKGYPVILRVDI